MTQDGAASGSRSPLPAIGLFALVTGGISLGLGFLGPLAFSSANLGPLLGVFVTGPVGALVGALMGCGVWARQSAGPAAAAIWKWIAGIWMISLLYSVFMIRFGPLGTIAGLAVQVAVLGVGAFLLVSPGTGTCFTPAARRCGPVALPVVALVAAMTLFPPVTRPWWGPAPVEAGSSAASNLPTFAFVLDPGFDASRQIPRFAVSIPVLVMEWAAVVAAGSIACLLLARRARSSGGDQPGTVRARPRP